MAGIKCVLPSKDEHIEFGGRDAEFLLKSIIIKGWNFENEIPVSPFEIVVT